jgi:cell division protein FtsB
VALETLYENSDDQRAAQQEAIAAAEARVAELTEQAETLQAQIATLTQEVGNLEARRDARLADEGKSVPELVMALVQDTLGTLTTQKEQLTAEVIKLEKRRDRIEAEMRKTFTGTSEEIAIRLQGFKNYLMGSLQDLAAATEQIDLPEPKVVRVPTPESRPAETEAPTPPFTKQRYQDQRRRITSILDQYRTMPDYYGPPWQLRRTFEPIHADRLQDWFFKQGGRGVIRSLGSRLQNVLVASAAIAVLRQLYGDRLQILVLANTPERLGEWRRGLQDCLGISRSDYGPTRGVALFEAPEALIQKAERLVEMKQLPLIVIDETEDVINLALLQFPLWLAFAPDPSQPTSYVY